MAKLNLPFNINESNYTKIQNFWKDMTGFLDGSDSKEPIKVEEALAIINLPNEINKAEVYKYFINSNGCFGLEPDNLHLIQEMI